MLRGILAILAGFVTWTVLWLGSNAVVAAALPGLFREDGSTESTALLLLLLLLSLVFSVIAGYIAAALAREHPMTYVIALAVLQLAVGIFVQTQYWDVLPVWYHLTFLALLVPGILLGAKARLGRPASVT